MSIDNSHAYAEGVFPELERLFQPSFRSDEVAEAKFLRLFAELDPLSFGGMTQEQRIDLSLARRSFNTLPIIAARNGMQDFVVFDYDQNPSESFNAAARFLTIPSSQMRNQEQEVYLAVDGASWGALRQAIGVRMPQLFDIQDQIHGGKAVFVTRKAFLGLLSHKPPRSRSNWGGH